MRFHRLRICAFGPFAGTEAVDFDALSTDGLFLLRGETGAGKTSVLDALTFALFGNVPGDRSKDHLKSQHPPADRVPYVELEFSSGEQRYWVRRQPTYFRPAKRAGAKPQREGTSMVLKRFENGQWKPVPTARVAEGDLELKQIVGLSMEEFTKVILLPQGAFAKLLHATNDQRRAILERLFEIGAYQRLEEYLWDQMRQAEAALKDVESQLHAQVSGVLNAAGSLLGDQAEPLAETDPEELSAAVTLQAQSQQQVFIESEKTARHAAHQAGEHAQSVRSARQHLLRWAAHVQRRDRLEDQRGEVEVARCRLTKHSAAAGIRDWLSAAQKSEEAHRVAQERAGQAAAEAQRALDVQEDIPDAQLRTEGTADPAAVEGSLTHLVQLQARLDDQQAAGAESRHTQLLSKIHSAEQVAAESLKHRDEIQTALEELQQRIAEKRGQLTDPETLQKHRDTRHRDLESACRTAELVDQRIRIQDRRARVQKEVEQRTETAQETIARYRDTAEAYLRSQAHELAATLKHGEPCLVCGSADHPAPLTTTEQATTREQVDAAAEKRHIAQAELEKSRAEFRSVTESLDQVYQNLPEHRELSPERADQLYRQAQQQLESAESEQARQRSLREELELLSERLSHTRQQHSSATHQTEHHTGEAQRLSAEAADLAQSIQRLRAGHPSIGKRRSALSTLEKILQAAQRGAQQEQNFAGEALRSRESADNQLEKSIFSTVGEVAAALCEDQELATLEQQVTQFDQAAQQLKFDAELPEVQDGARRAEQGEQTPSQQTLTEAETAEHEATEHHRIQQDGLTAFTARVQALSESTDALQRTLASRAAQTQELMRRADLARTINGKGENALSMRLTTFVLAARLERIAEAATYHLSAMTAGRYQLLLDAERSGPGLRGLDLKVHDEYAEQQRPAESLSGGETFMTSLAMALGLAEVVQAEAGGIGMESLFIDEGFGSLDEHTLEDVMAALHTLQGEGRRVGVVSHVSEMHQQIPVQLRVAKTRSGSTLHMELPT